MVCVGVVEGKLPTLAVSSVVLICHREIPYVSLDAFSLCTHNAVIELNKLIYLFGTQVLMPLKIILL